MQRSDTRAGSCRHFTCNLATVPSSYTPNGLKVALWQWPRSIVPRCERHYSVPLDFLNVGVPGGMSVTSVRDLWGGEAVAFDRAGFRVMGLASHDTAMCRLEIAASASTHV